MCLLPWFLGTLVLAAGGAFGVDPFNTLAAIYTAPDGTTGYGCTAFIPISETAQCTVVPPLRPGRPKMKPQFPHEAREPVVLYDEVRHVSACLWVVCTHLHAVCLCFACTHLHALICGLSVCVLHCCRNPHSFALFSRGFILLLGLLIPLNCSRTGGWKKMSCRSMDLHVFSPTKRYFCEADCHESSERNRLLLGH